MATFVLRKKTGDITSLKLIGHVIKGWRDF